MNALCSGNIYQNDNSSCFWYTSRCNLKSNFVLIYFQIDGSTSSALLWSRVVRRPSVRPSLTFHIFDFFSETSEENSTKLDMKQYLIVPFQVCVFRVDPKNTIATLASDWLRRFRLLLWNRCTEFNETWQEARSQCPLPSLCFWADRKNKIGWDILNFSSETAERNRKQDHNVFYQ